MSAVAVLTTSLGVAAPGFAATLFGNIGSPPNRIYGAEQSIGNGMARAYIDLSGSQPLAVGVEFTPEILNQLPALPMGQTAEVKLPVPPALSVTPFKGISLEYSPGHAPAGPQDIPNESVPHLHPTFFMFSDQERQQVQPNAPAAAVPVAEPELPGNHISTGVTVPTEGTGYYQPFLDAYSPVSMFVPVRRPFASTAYQYYFWNGHMNGLQLTVANSFIPKQQEQDGSIVPPQQYAQPGYYPSHYTFQYDPARQVYTMSVDGFIQADAKISSRGTLPDLPGSQGQTTYGAAQVVGNGLMRSYVTRSAGQPSAVGLEFNQGALSGLPFVADTFPQDYPLPAPPELQGSGFKSVSLIWMPGPIPPYAQKVGFFQSNFWFITRDERYQIFPFTLPPSLLTSDKIPAGTVATPPGLPTPPPVPFEGQIYFDPTDPNWGVPGMTPPVFHGARVNYVAWNGNLAGIEVSATLNGVFANHQEVSLPLPQPQTYPIPEPYPTRYHVKSYDNPGVYTVSVEGFVPH